MMNKVNTPPTMGAKNGIKPATLAAPLVPCVKCGKRGEVSSPSGAVYCQQCGRCQRRVYGVMQGVVVLREECNTSVDKFVKHPRMGIYVCPCILEFERQIKKYCYLISVSWTS